MTDTTPDEARWFAFVGMCRCGCGKLANGILRGPANKSLGPYARQCAETRLDRAKVERAKFKEAYDDGA